MSESRQQRRARERAEQKATIAARVHPRVTGARSVRHLWDTYAVEVLASHGITTANPETALALELFRRAFYAGAASMFELVTRVAPDAVSEDDGAAMLQRLEDEITTFARSLGDESPTS